MQARHLRSSSSFVEQESVQQHCVSGLSPVRAMPECVRSNSAAQTAYYVPAARGVIQQQVNLLSAAERANQTTSPMRFRLQQPGQQVYAASPNANTAFIVPISQQLQKSFCGSTTVQQNSVHCRNTATPYLQSGGQLAQANMNFSLAEASFSLQQPSPYRQHRLQQQSPSQGGNKGLYQQPKAGNISTTTTVAAISGDCTVKSESQTVVPQIRATTAFVQRGEDRSQDTRNVSQLRSNPSKAIIRVQEVESELKELRAKVRSLEEREIVLVQAQSSDAQEIVRLKNQLKEAQSEQQQQTQEKKKTLESDFYKKESEKLRQLLQEKYLDLEKLQLYCNELTFKCKRAEEREGEANTLAKQVRQELKVCSTENIQLRECKESTSTNESDKRILKNLQSELSAKEEILSLQNTQLADMRQKIRSSETEISRLRDSLQKAESLHKETIMQKQRQEGENATALLRLKEQQNAHCQNLEQQLASAKIEIDSFCAQVQTLRQEHEQLITACEVMRLERVQQQQQCAHCRRSQQQNQSESAKNAQQHFETLQEQKQRLYEQFQALYDKSPKQRSQITAQASTTQLTKATDENSTKLTESFQRQRSKSRTLGYDSQPERSRANSGVLQDFSPNKNGSFSLYQSRRSGLSSNNFSTVTMPLRKSIDHLIDTDYQQKKRKNSGGSSTTTASRKSEHARSQSSCGKRKNSVSMNSSKKPNMRELEQKIREAEDLKRYFESRKIDRLEAMSEANSFY